MCESLSEEWLEDEWFRDEIFLRVPFSKRRKIMHPRKKKLKVGKVKVKRFDNYDPILDSDELQRAIGLTPAEWESEQWGLH